jgi:hypothetical protein
MLPMNVGAPALEKLAVLVFPNTPLRCAKGMTQHGGL